MNNSRNRRDRGEGWFDKNNQYDNEHRYRDQEFSSFRQTGYGGDRNSGMNENESDRNSWQNQSWRNDQDINRRSDYQQTSNRGSGSYGSPFGNRRNEEWGSRDSWQHPNDNYRSSMNQGWNSRNINSGNYSSPYSNDYNRGMRNDRDDRDYGNSEERNWWDKTRDEVSSWFGDDDAQRRRRMDEMREGGHKGKGPREYQRSPERIREDVYDRLSDHDYIDASDIQVRVENNEVVLTGTVNSRQQKRLAEDIVESVSGVKHVENRIRVQDSNSGSGSGLFQNTTGDATGMNNPNRSGTSQSGTTNEIIRDTTKGNP